jgi:hypothetical protein
VRAPIRGSSNKYHENILISEVLNQQLPESSAVQTSLIDHLALKGKQESIGIFSVMLN